MPPQVRVVDAQPIISIRGLQCSQYDTVMAFRLLHVLAQFIRPFHCLQPRAAVCAALDHVICFRHVEVVLLLQVRQRRVGIG